ncbi:MAG: endonuclease domain-containing protein [Candidatus Margulisiibacteriota bacterium]
MKEIKKQFVRYLRKESTPAETKLWRILRNRKLCKLKFRRQHIIEGFAVDFYCRAYKLAIEIDGGIHLEQKEYDREREIIIRSKDVTLLRFSNEDIFNNMDTVLNRINKETIERKRNTLLLPLGEGCPAEGQDEGR